WVGQPIRQMDVSLFKQLSHRVEQPLMADESMVTPQNLRTFIEDQSVDYIKIKLMKRGGVYGAYQLATQAELFGIACQIGSMVESIISCTAAVHAPAPKERIISTGISGPTKFTEEIGDLTYDLPAVHLPSRPGVGIDINENQLKKLTISHETIVNKKENV